MTLSNQMENIDKEVEIFFFFLMFVFERKRQIVSGLGAERERQTRNPKQAPGSELSAQGSKPRAVRS